MEHTQIHSGKLVWEIQMHECVSFIQSFERERERESGSKLASQLQCSTISSSSSQEKRTKLRTPEGQMRRVMMHVLFVQSKLNPSTNEYE